MYGLCTPFLGLVMVCVETFPVRRIVAEMLNLENAHVAFDFSIQEEFEEEMKSPSYPGVAPRMATEHHPTKLRGL